MKKQLVSIVFALGIANLFAADLSYNLRGSVEDENGDPISNVSVNLIEAGVSVKSKGDGSYTLSNLEATSILDQDSYGIRVNPRSIEIRNKSYQGKVQVNVHSLNGSLIWSMNNNMGIGHQSIELPQKVQQAKVKVIVVQIGSDQIVAVMNGQQVALKHSNSPRALLRETNGTFHLEFSHPDYWTLTKEITNLKANLGIGVLQFYDPTADEDFDGISNAEEKKKGTDPRQNDTDKDGVSDGVEIALGTNPLIADSDKDGSSDGDERAAGTNPLDSKSGADTDRDGLSDAQEKTLGTDPLVADSDKDGVSDGVEIANETNPNKKDTDGDGLTDNEELSLGTNPGTADTDMDGIPDETEVSQNTNPLQNESSTFLGSVIAKYLPSAKSEELQKNVDIAKLIMGACDVSSVSELATLFGSQIPGLVDAKTEIDLTLNMFANSVLGIFPAPVMVKKTRTLDNGNSEEYLKLYGKLADGLPEAELNIYQGTCDLELMFAVGTSFQPSKIHSTLGFMDGMRIESNLLMRTSTGNGKQFDKMNDFVKEQELDRGFYLVGALNTRGTGIDQVLQLQSLGVLAGLPVSLSEGFDNVFLTAFADYNIGVGPFTIEDATMTIKPNKAEIPGTDLVGVDAPESVTGVRIRFEGHMTVELGSDKLDLRAGVEVDQAAAAVYGNMSGIHHNAFGIPGVDIDSIAYFGGINYEALAAQNYAEAFSAGMAGQLVIPGKKIGGAFLWDARQTVNPKPMFKVDLGNIHLIQMLSPYYGTAITYAAGDYLPPLVLDSAHGYFAASDVEIGRFKYASGITVQGNMRFWGWNMFADCHLNEGLLKIKGGVGPLILIPNVFEIRGSQMRAGTNAQLSDSLMVDMVVSKDSVRFYMTGKVTVLGLTQEADIQVLPDSGFRATMAGSIFNQFETDLTVYSNKTFNDQSKIGDNLFGVRGNLKNDFKEYLQNDVANFVKTSSAEAQSSIENHQEDVDKAEQEVANAEGAFDLANEELDKVNGALDVAEEEAKKAKIVWETAVNGLVIAENAVTTAEENVGKAEAVLKAAEDEFDRLNGELEVARGVLKDAQIAYDEAKKVFDAANALVAELTGTLREITALYNELLKPIQGLKNAVNNAKSNLKSNGDKIEALKKEIERLSSQKLTYESCVPKASECNNWSCNLGCAWYDAPCKIREGLCYAGALIDNGICIGNTLAVTVQDCAIQGIMATSLGAQITKLSGDLLIEEGKTIGLTLALTTAEALLNAAEGEVRKAADNMAFVQGHLNDANKKLTEAAKALLNPELVLKAANTAFDLAQKSVNAAQVTVDEVGHAGVRAAELALEVANAAVGESKTLVEESKKALDIVDLAFAAAKEAVKLAQAVVDESRKSLDAANFVLTTYNKALEDIQVAMKTVTDLSNYILTHGIESVLNVKEARFDAGVVKDAIDGAVKLHLVVEFQGKEMTYDLNYNLKDSASSAAEFSKKLLEDMKIL